MMKRVAIASSPLLLMLLAPAVWGQVTVHVRSQEKPLKGTIKQENPKGIVLIGVKAPIAAGDITDIEFEVKPTATRLQEYRPARAAEKDADDPGQEAKRNAHLALAIKKYEAALKSLEPGQASAATHIEYKIATLLAAQEREEGFPLGPAITKLKDFKARHPNSWQITNVLKLLGDLLLAEKQYAEAEQTYKELAAADVPETTREAAEFWAAQVPLRARKYPEAQSKLQTLLSKLPKDSPYAARARIAQAECLNATNKTADAKKLLLTVLNGTRDRNLKAAAYNALGESYYQANLLKEARWEFLWVDVVYNQDKAEHAKALYYLGKIFEALNEPERAQECRETLLTDRQFLGSEYRQRLLREKKTQ